MTTHETKAPRSTRRRYVLVATLAVGVVGATSVQLPALAAVPTRAGVAVSVKNVSLAQQKATLAYWTPQRRASAISADIVTRKPLPAVQKQAAAAIGKPGKVAGALPAKAVRSSARLTPDTAASYPFPYKSFNVATSNYTKNPYRLNGWIYFTNNGGNYVCSGTSVASYHGTSVEDEVWTAGHCVSNTSLSSPGVFDSYAEFIPAYNGNASNYDPYGIFVAKRYSVATNFLNHGDISVDEGAMEVGTSSTTGRTLGQAVGYSGFAWNYSPNENFVAFGYPAAAPYSGNLMVEDEATTASSVAWSGGAGQNLIGIGNPMTGGSSGGAWDIDWTTTSAGYINGHNDYKFYSQPNAMYSPYQDTLSNTVRCFGASSC